MYSVYYGTKASTMQCLWMPGRSDDKYACYDLKMELAVSEAGSVSFTLPQSNAAYDSIQTLITLIEVRDTLAVNKDSSSEDYNPDGVVWDGRVLSIERDFYNQKVVTCEGALAFLSDTVQLWESGYVRDTPQAFVKAVLDGYKSSFDQQEHGHNDLSPKRQIHYEWKSGSSYIDSGIGSSTVTIDELEMSSYTTSLSLLQSAFSVYDGFFYIKYRGTCTDTNSSEYGHRLRYLGYKLTANVVTSDQPISFGENLIDLTESIDATEVVNSIHPFGALQDDEAENPTIFDRWQLDTVLSDETYSKAEAARLVKEASTGRLTSGYYYSDTPSEYGLYDWVIRRSNADSIYAVPPVWEVVVFDDIGAWTEDSNGDKHRDDPWLIREKLVKAAVDYLESKIQKELVINVTAVDLRDAGQDYSRMWPGNKYVINSVPHGYSQTLTLTSCSIAIQNPESNKYTLGYTGGTMSDDVFRTSKDLDALTQEVQLLEASNGSALKQAKQAQETAESAVTAAANAQTSANNAQTSANTAQDMANGRSIVTVSEKSTKTDDNGYYWRTVTVSNYNSSDNKWYSTTFNVVTQN